VSHTVDPTAAVRRRAVAAALIVAPWGFVIANACYAWATRDGGSDQNGAETLALAAAHPGLLRIAVVAAMVGSLLIVPAVLGAIRLTRARAPRLGLAGGTLMIAGYVCYLGINGTGFEQLAMAEHGGPLGAFAEVIDAGQQDAAGLWVFLLFVLGNLVGTALLGVALLRSRAVPAWAAVAVLAWPVLHVAGLVAGSEWFEVTGAALQALGLAAAGMAVLRSGAGRPAGRPAQTAAPTGASA
jgi:hypothetical protein